MCLLNQVGDRPKIINVTKNFNFRSKLQRNRFTKQVLNLKWSHPSVGLIL